LKQSDTARLRSPAARNALKSFRGLGMTEFAETLRHYCRNPRCRSKLKEPVDAHRAFCTPGCHSSFYLKRCLVCENDKPAGSTARRKLCRRPKCEARYRKNSAHYSFLGADTACAANVPSSAQSTGIKSADFDARPWYIVAGPKITAAVYHCATLPVDPDIAARARVNDWDRIRKEIVWSKPRPPAPKENAIGLEAALAKRSGRGRSLDNRISETRAGDRF
jgi:hypothetical protein